MYSCKISPRVILERTDECCYLFTVTQLFFSLPDSPKDPFLSSWYVAIDSGLHETTAKSFSHIVCSLSFGCQLHGMVHFQVRFITTVFMYRVYTRTYKDLCAIVSSHTHTAHCHRRTPPLVSL